MTSLESFTVWEGTTLDSYRKSYPGLSRTMRVEGSSRIVFSGVIRNIRQAVEQRNGTRVAKGTGKKLQMSTFI